MAVRGTKVVIALAVRENDGRAAADRLPGTDVALVGINRTAMTTKLIYAAVLGAFCALTACSNAPESADTMEQKVDNAMEELRAGKDDMNRELHDLREKLAVELTRAEERLKDPALTDEERTEWEGFKVEVNDQIERLDASLNDVETATSEKWEEVKEGSSRTADDVGNWFQRQAEKIDQKTDADHDNDGH